MALSKEEILDAIAEMSVIDIVDLIEAMEEKFGVSAAAPVAAAAPAAASGDAGGEAEADEVNVPISELGDTGSGETAVGPLDPRFYSPGAPRSVFAGLRINW